MPTRHRSIRLSVSAAALAALLAATTARVALRAQFPSAQPTTRPAGVTGKAVYDAHCSYCHGDDGKGDGPASSLLTPSPRDFTAAKYKLRSTDTGQLPTDDDLLQSVRKGLNGTAMPPWQAVL